METTDSLKVKIAQLQAEIEQLKLSQRLAAFSSATYLDYLNSQNTRENSFSTHFTLDKSITEHELKLQNAHFLTSTSHELNTPLTSIYASLQLISRLLKDSTESSVKVTQLVNLAQTQTLKLNQAVADLLNITDTGEA